MMTPGTRAATTETGEALLASSSTLADLSFDIFSLGADVRFQASGLSMHPFIHDGDIITLGSLLGRKPGFGDIVAFVHPHTRRLTVHRVVDRKNGLLVTKGDAASRPDVPVPEAQILGRVTRIDRNKKRASLGLGPERLAIALLSRCRFRFTTSVPLWSFVRPLLRRFSL